MKHIIVLGVGFAGLWSAVGAAHKLDELGIPSDEVQISLVNQDADHSIRVRNYEQGPTSEAPPLRVPLDQVLSPIGVTRVEGVVTGIDFDKPCVAVVTTGGGVTLSYDRLVLATGSHLFRPAIPGLANHALIKGDTNL